MKKIILAIFCLSVLGMSSQNYKFLGEFNSDGTPLYLENPGDIISSETLQMISNSLPENYPVPEYNPHYISSGYDTDIILDDTAEVWVTFVGEGAGYKNVLGFYTYDINNPLSKAPTTEDITIIFPNVSGLNSGGGLQAGDKVKLGTFAEGTGIGFILIANGWSSSSQSVGYGQWQLYSNPDFNPESNEFLRYHNVLLNDPENERIILGFEDIRRDYGSCDNDFNDAIFYITASPYSALNGTNYADVESASDVTSANDGGLESNGKLATAIAKRNFTRIQKGQVYNKKNKQIEFIKSVNLKQAKDQNLSIENYLPNTGMFGTETAYISSPEDLIPITNATEVFSLDLYKDDLRVSAVLATATQGKVYDHSKVICDRLNNSSLEDVRTVQVRGHEIISSKIVRSTGEVEYSLSFSVKLGPVENELLSFWTIDQYPVGDFKNFQIWGSSFSQVFTICNYIIDTFQGEKPLKVYEGEVDVPNVFVKSGSYSNGNLILNIKNTTNAVNLQFETSLSPTETSSPITNNGSINLSGEREETVRIQTGSLFDVGIALFSENDPQHDALYLADGPWGVDYHNDYASLSSFNVINENMTYTDELHEVERQPRVAGTVTGNVNLFRHLLPGEQTLDVKEYEAIQFRMSSDQPVEVILMPKDLADWNDRLRFTIPVSSEEKFYNIAFSEFVDSDGQHKALTDLKTIVFSVLGDYANEKSFQLSISEVALGEVQRLSTNTFKPISHDPKIYPNPLASQSFIEFFMHEPEEVSLKIYNQIGALVFEQGFKTNLGKNTIPIYKSDYSSGLYVCKITSGRQNFRPIKIVVN